MKRRDDIDELIADLKEMARRVGARFIPDAKKVAAFRKARADQQFQHKEG